MARLAQEAEVLAGIVLENYGKVDAFLEVLLDGLNDGRLPAEGQVDSVGAGFGAKPNTVTGPEVNAGNGDAVQARAGAEEIIEVNGW